MSNSRAMRRRLAVSRKAIDKRRRDRVAGRYPFGGPSLSSVRRWLNQLVAAGLAEREVQRTGKPGRPPYAYRLTEAGMRSPTDERPAEDVIVDERLTTLLRRAKGKALTEDQIIARYKEAMARRDAAARELERVS